MPEAVTQRASRGAVVLRTKLHAPPLRPELFARGELIDHLAADPPRLTLVGAGAGWGKSTLLAQWHASDASHFGWLSLEVADNDPVRFWTYIVLALQTVCPALGKRALLLLRTPGVDVVEGVLPELLNDVGAQGESLMLVLDDYHAITNSDIHRQMTFFVEHLPRSLRLVIATRSDPPLPLGRLRARGEVAEVRVDGLRFSDAESSLFLNDVLGLELTEEDVASLHERTEGWAAGLYLAALSLRGRRDRGEFIAAFAGDDRQLVDYLGAEVLDGLPVDPRTFLLRSSVLERLSGELCDAVTGLENSGERLEQIERSNLFLVPLDTTRDWFRYHHLFGQLLRRELERSEPEVVPELHRRASAWYRENDEVADAIHHATAAGDVDLASDLIAAHWNAFANEGKLVTVTAWLDALPADSVASDARLCLARAWHALLTGRTGEVEGWIARAEGAALAGPIRDGTSSIESGAALIRSIHRYYLGDVGECERWARRALQLEEEASPWYSMAYSGIAAARFWRGEAVAAASALDETSRLALAGGNMLSALWALEFRAVLAAECGDPDLAEQLVGRAVALAAEHGLEEHWVHAAAKLALAYASEARGERVVALAEAEGALELVRRGPGVMELALTLITLARLAPERASEWREEARRTVAACPDPGFLRTRVRAPQPEVPRQGGELSEREYAVLRLLPTRLSLREIGSELYVSQNTVKTHVRGIYRKLSASSRAEVVARARELGLL
jgi:LuxR family maltose regulon positive regulatory protein